MPKQILNKKPSGIIANNVNSNNTPTIIKQQGKIDNNNLNMQIRVEPQGNNFNNNYMTAEPKLQNKSKIIENNQIAANYQTPKNNNLENKFNKQSSVQSNLER